MADRADDALARAMTDNAALAQRVRDALSLIWPRTPGEMVVGKEEAARLLLIAFRGYGDERERRRAEEDANIALTFMFKVNGKHGGQAYADIAGEIAEAIRRGGGEVTPKRAQEIVDACIHDHEAVIAKCGAALVALADRLEAVRSAIVALMALLSHGQRLSHLILSEDIQKTQRDYASAIAAARKAMAE